jgi:hypothetical protein
MAVVLDPASAWWQELRSAVAASPTGTLLHDGVWKPQILDGRPVVCLLIGGQWWRLGLKPTRSGPQSAALQKIVSGAAISGELFFHRKPVKEAAGGSFRILCRIRTWLPREPPGERL